MNDLPLDLLDEILFKLEPIYLTSMRCTNKFFRTYISDQKFVGDESCMFHLSSYGANYVYCMPFITSCASMSSGNEVNLLDHRCYILGSCSGLLLLYIDGLFIANPLTKRVRILDHTGSKLLPDVVGGDDIRYKDSSYPEGNVARTKRAMCIGFAVNQNRTTQRFKIVCILEMQTTYIFEISDGDSWRLSETTIKPSSKSDLTMRMKPVYLDDTLHWLRTDGSIIAFSPATEKARLIPSRFHQKQDMKLFFAADEKINRLALISGTKEAISVYTLLGNQKWNLTRRIKNISTEEKDLICWNVVAYDGHYLILREKKDGHICGIVHVYDMETNNWGVLGSTCTTCWANDVRDFYKFTPSLFFVEGNEQKKVVVPPTDLQILYLTMVMGLIDING